VQGHAAATKEWQKVKAGRQVAQRLYTPGTPAKQESCISMVQGTPASAPSAPKVGIMHI